MVPGKYPGWLQRSRRNGRAFRIRGIGTDGLMGSSRIDFSWSGMFLCRSISGRYLRSSALLRFRRLEMRRCRLRHDAVCVRLGQGSSDRLIHPPWYCNCSFKARTTQRDSRNKQHEFQVLSEGVRTDGTQESHTFTMVWTNPLSSQSKLRVAIHSLTHVGNRGLLSI